MTGTKDSTTGLCSACIAVRIEASPWRAISFFPEEYVVKAVKQLWWVLAGLVMILSGNWPMTAAADGQQDPFAQLEQRANNGDVEAQADLGKAYALGKGVERNYVVARGWLLKAAANGRAESQAILGYIYRDGLGTDKDMAEAVKWFHAAADQGLASAQTNLAMLYKNGQGVTQSDTEALIWFRKAADQGDVYAQTNIGLIYEAGQGVPQDYKIAAEWYQKAAERQHEIAQRKLAYLYETGQGVPKDYVKSYTWYAIASVWRDSDGEPMAADDPRLRIGAHMTQEQISAANQAAAEWWNKHFSEVGGQ